MEKIVFNYQNNIAVIHHEAPFSKSFKETFD